MQAIGHAVPLRRALALAAVAVVAAAGTSYADEDLPKPPTTQVKGGNHEGNLNAAAGYSVVPVTPGATDPGRKQIASVDTSWTPPPCWFGPKYGAQEFKDKYTQSYKEVSPQVHGSFSTAMGQDLAHYQDGFDYPGEKGYKDFNVEQEGKGQWWAVSTNPAASEFDQMSCNDQNPKWVPNGDPPPAGTRHVITPEMLSKLAYASTRLPGVTITMSPATAQTVNLPTWVWLKEKYTPVKVRASVDLGGGRQIWAETTAKASSVRIEPGTPDATVFPGSGECPIASDGTVGAAYSKGAAGNPPCGVTYLRSTARSGAYQLNVTATWTVTWVGSNGAGDGLPNGVIDEPKPVTVREIQSIVR
ncbi:hypothetical protein [Streptomyces sp. SPB162]|uniref:hypothetical protein n=1 Tax=Streptomyces sp. SPB162 TaxID=2940560 RepID=UPI0024075853|nr:hypothetical protein [Streptomyces sp. SPB162]MDF9815493.1 enoyl reductase [Streptomyces sp. SPB162]